MNIIIFGAGAIGSLFGALLNRNNDVTLIGRPYHINVIKKNGLKIEGKTKLYLNMAAMENIKQLKKTPDLLILAVKSYDTTQASKTIKKLVDRNTIVLTLQNGLDNIDKIEKFIDRDHILVGVTTQGAYLSKPGVVRHTGLGKTTIGELNGEESERLKNIIRIFNESFIETVYSENITRDIWIKAIINSCINPITTIFRCKNGYLQKNPILNNIVRKIIDESINVANKHGMNISKKFVLDKTKKVVKSTEKNYSSMLQSFNKGQKTEIDSINKKIVEIGKFYSIDVSLNELMVDIIESLTLN